MRKTFSIDLAIPSEKVKELAQEAGDRPPKWRRTDSLQWKIGSHAGLKGAGKAIAEVVPGSGEMTTLRIKFKRFGLFDAFGLLKNDYRDFYDELEPLVRAENKNIAG